MLTNIEGIRSLVLLSSAQKSTTEPKWKVINHAHTYILWTKEFEKLMKIFKKCFTLGAKNIKFLHKMKHALLNQNAIGCFQSRGHFKPPIRSQTLDKVNKKWSDGCKYTSNTGQLGRFLQYVILHYSFEVSRRNFWRSTNLTCIEIILVQCAR